MSIVNLIRAGTFKNIIIASGAGVSTNAGIPDAKSMAKNGSNFQVFLNKEPTSSHFLGKYFDDRGLLKRVYTQNVDGLYQKTGLPDSKIVEFHGSFLKNSIVQYGNSIDRSCIDRVVEDFTEDVDLIIVMGTRLKVAPFCALPNLVSKSCTRVLVGLHPEEAFQNSFSKKKTSPTDMYSSLASLLSYTKFGRTKVSLRQQWGKDSKWSTQYIVQEDCDAWSNQIMS